MNTKTNRKPFARLMAVLMSFAMVVSVVFMQASAEKAEFAPPTKAMVVDQKNWITTAAHSQGWITPEVLGITNTTSRTQELPVNEDGSVGMTLENAKKHAALGVFGSDINDVPNPYHYNYFYNVYAAANGLQASPLGTYTLSQGIVGIGPAQAATTPGYSKYGTTVPGSFYLEPDILLGVGSIDKSTNPPTTGYTSALNTYNEAKLAAEPGAKAYNPYQIDYVTPHVYSFLQTMYELADVVDQIKAADNTKATRYGDPQVITSDIEKYVKGLESYVIKQMKKDNVKPLTVAVVDSGMTNTFRASNAIQSNEFVLNDKNTSSQSTTTYSRVGEFVADTSVNLVDAIGNLEKRDTPAQAGQRQFNATYYVCTADQIAEMADVVLFCDVLSSVPENQGNSKTSAFKQDVQDNCTTQALKEKVNDIEVMSSTFDCVGSIGANSCENLLGMAYYTAYLYPQYLNQFDVAAYWYENFYHVSDLDKLKSVMASNFATSSVQDAYAGQYSAANLNYDKQAIEDKIIEGMMYYEDNEDEFKDKLIYQNGKTGENTGWELDWSQGIGSGADRCPDGGTHNVTAVPAKEATCTETGLTAGEKCADCGKVIKAQEVIQALGHDFKDGKCTRCDATDPNYKPSEPDKPTPTPTPAPKQNGLADSADSNGDWWFYKDGKIDTTHNGVDQNKYGWWRVENGKVNFNAQGIYQNGFGWWKTTNGKVTFKEEGVFQNNFGWWRVKDSKVDFNAQSIYQNKFGWWKTTNGKVTFKENGLFSNQYGTWKVENSKVNFNFNGKYQGKTIKNGKVV